MQDKTNIPPVDVINSVGELLRNIKPSLEVLKEKYSEDNESSYSPKGLGL
ncbi:type IVB secretion system protein CoxigA/IcmR [Coxiella burnetii]|uniref:Uncharacterized protein n=2 Tax=Coxiella burnetii TaxID=777 RepID=B5QSE4_COXBU|nr:type IVB secretion system protein CoxigA/IcmR [Coxiella burnetii]YP_002333017.1 hypothetical protein CBU_1634a [Coxiella burnetii RSA 493]ABS76619.1 hypothetical protein CBUD_0363 [Coxiella burnetii Dugway 5J108-111]ABX78701.1 hypothetical protein COXBURSA331_A1819 [Coxiella burnetii RSA 331]ACI15308.1 hypothetical protein CBU_1634a [Coxiella burnetii RSA 493]ACJ17819.1 hypothetical protein CbuG_0388 [Coxiella burnetii CbuG_Q212]ACJ20975.1 hypothetical protein CbuK_1857 [Coxiella burnetii 